MKHYEIIVTGKIGIFDPAGETSKNALLNLGYSGVENLSIGKYMELSVDDDVSDNEVREMCEKLLANPVIEDFHIKEIDSTQVRPSAQASATTQTQAPTDAQASATTQTQAPVSFSSQPQTQVPPHTEA